MLSKIKTNISDKLEDKAYRTKFFRGQAQYEIAFRLRSARKKRGFTQPKLEKLSGMKQSAISRLEQASYSHWNFQSLLCLADALDLRVRVVFDYAEDVIAEYKQMEQNDQSGSGNYIVGYHGLGNDALESALPITNPQMTGPYEQYVR